MVHGVHKWENSDGKTQMGKLISRRMLIRCSLYACRWLVLALAHVLALVLVLVHVLVLVLVLALALTNAERLVRKKPTGASQNAELFE